MTSSVTRSLEIRDHFVTIQQIEYAPDVISGAYFVPESGVSRLGFEPRTLGLKVRCSAKLSYRPTKIEGATFTGSNSMGHRNILDACALQFMIPPPTRL